MRKGAGQAIAGLGGGRAGSPTAGLAGGFTHNGHPWETPSFLLGC